MAYDLKREEDVKEYLENLGIEYRFGCFKEKKPEVCHLLGDYFEAVRKDFEKAKKVFKSNCLDYGYAKSCLKIGNYALVGKGGQEIGNTEEAYTYFEKGCELGEPTACLHAGLLLTARGPNVKVKRDIVKGHKYLKQSCEGDVDMGCHYLSGMFISGVPENPDDYEKQKPGNKNNIKYAIKPDMRQAFEYAKKGCELGNMFACANVSIMYKKGDGTEKDENLSKKYFEVAQELQKADERSKNVKFQQGLDDKKK